MYLLKFIFNYFLFFMVCFKIQVMKKITTTDRPLLLSGGSNNDVIKNPMSILNKLLDLTQLQQQQEQHQQSSSPSQSGNLSILPFIIIPSLPQIALITGLSFTMAELFNYCGIFHDEIGDSATNNAREFINSHESVEHGLADLSYHALDWIEYNIKDDGGLFHLPTVKKRVEHLFRMQTIDFKMNRLSFKHQWAIGSTIGMVFHSSAIVIAKVFTIAYLLSEMSANIVSTHVVENNGSDSRFYNGIQDFFDNEEDSTKTDETIDFIFDAIRYSRRLVIRCLGLLNRKLKWFRLKIRSIISCPQESLGEIMSGDWLDSEGTLIAGFVFGILLGQLLSSH